VQSLELGLDAWGRMRMVETWRKVPAETRRSTPISKVTFSWELLLPLASRVMVELRRRKVARLKSGEQRVKQRMWRK